MQHIKLKDLLKEITDVIAKDPTAEERDVINFNYISRKSSPVKLPLTYNGYLVIESNGKEHIYDTMDEVKAENFDSSVRIKKVTLI